LPKPNLNMKPVKTLGQVLRELRQAKDLEENNLPRREDTQYNNLDSYLESFGITPD